MKNLAMLMSTYHRYHTKEMTRLTHFIGIPCIFLGMQIFASFFHFSFLFMHHISFAWAAMCALLMYYFVLDKQMAAATAAFLMPMTYVAELIAQYNSSAFMYAVIFFVGGWAAQMIGHYVEEKRPAFMDDFNQLLIAPIFLVSEIVFAMGFCKDLQKQVADCARQTV